jgi:DnaJ-class molecular chaperone
MAANACDTCHGLGQVEQPYHYIDEHGRPHTTTTWVTCGSCNGSGTK